MVASAISTSFTCSSVPSWIKTSPFRLLSHRSSNKAILSVLSSSSGDHYSSNTGLSSRSNRFSLKLDKSGSCSGSNASNRNGPIEASSNPPIMPAVMTPGGPLDLSSILFGNRIIFIGNPINSQVAQRVISQLVTLAAIDEDSDILMYMNCPGGSTYSVLAVYDCMSWIKPKVGTVGFGVVAGHAALLLAGAEKGMRYAMPNTRIMIHQPWSGVLGDVLNITPQANEAVKSRHKIVKMFAAFTGQPLETIQDYTDRDRFLSAAESMEFGLIDGMLETET
ncbi:hypothetical protein Cgig2_020116 [Carnegiea gigantea]|uniref:ATP-dependent Clp protease proteolytic subunit n=1 Tax=Carnegiea gigantea TaxID=171969 RepID=A0A9Q1KD69_9CARY|nr:hypothetical protein Cgig2_020116 [Carnegiea gigantea]